MHRILVIDDEPINLEIICEHLDDGKRQLTTADGAMEAWRLLCSHDFDLVILDRMMPETSGVELLRWMKADERLRATPVIMQTAAALAEQVCEGIAAGAYYYLVKPYDAATLLAIVRSALDFVDERKRLNRYAYAQLQAMDMLDSAQFTFSRLEEVGPLIKVLAGLCPEPQVVAVSLSELMVNAIEHGNLGISYAEKKRLCIADKWQQEVQRRLGEAPYAGRRARINFSRGVQCLQFTISDEGDGFDWRRYIEFDPGRLADPNGRGIAMIGRLGFSCLEYRGNGNTVVATINLAP